MNRTTPSLNDGHVVPSGKRHRHPRFETVSGLDYAPLPKLTMLRPSSAEASIKLEVGCNHHVVCYCAMLDYEDTQAVLTPHAPPGEENSATCILGPEVSRASLTKLLLTSIGNIV